MKQADLLTADSVINVLFSNPVNHNCLVRITDSTRLFSAVYACNADGSVKKTELPIGYYSAFSPTLNAEQNYGALAISINGDSYHQIWGIDLSREQIEIERLNKVGNIDYLSGEDLRFTPNDRYLIYNIAASSGEMYHFSAREQWIAYDIQTGKSIRGIGKFLRYIHDGNTAILETTSGGKIMDLSTGQDLTDKINLQD